MTPRVFARELEAARLRAIDDYRRDLTQAWNDARCYALVRSKKGLPPLQKLLSDVKESRGEDRQTPMQMRAVLNMYGLKGRKAKGRGAKRGQ